jgi:hypothetical protein
MSVNLHDEDTNIGYLDCKFIKKGSKELTLFGIVECLGDATHVKVLHHLCKICFMVNCCLNAGNISRWAA